MKNLFSIMLAALLGASLLQTAHGVVPAGQALHQQHCVACHAKGFGQNGAEIYTREDRRVNSLGSLIAQVNLCKNNLGLAWFDEEVGLVVEYLNQQYYHFE